MTKVNILDEKNKNKSKFNISLQIGLYLEVSYVKGPKKKIWVQ